MPLLQIAATPQLVIEANGAELPVPAIHALQAIRVQQRLSLPSLCELTFANPADSEAIDGILAPGVEIKVTTHQHRTPLFVGQVTAVEYVYGPSHQRLIHVRSYDALHSLRKRQSVRAHVQITIADLANELVSGLGLSVQADEPGPFWQRLIQHRQTDFELLAETAGRYGLYLTLREDVLHLTALGGIGEPLSLTLGESLLEARFDVNGDPATRKVSAVGWDALNVEPHQGNAASARLGRDVPAEVDPGALNGDGERKLVDESTPDDRHVEGIAQAELDRRMAREVTLTGVAEGDPNLQPGAVVRIAGVADSISGRYVLTSVNHIVDERVGFVSEISTVPPPAAERPRGAVATLGVVSQVDDPQSLGRVRVTLPTYGNVETEWMGVLSLGAGKGKGLMILPNVGDQVLVLLAHEDPGQGIVLGGLYGVKGAPEPGVQGKAVERFTLLTPGGQRIYLDDPKRLVRLENSDGTFVELAPGTVKLHAAANLEIEAPGHKIVIRGSAIDFERG